MAIAIEWNEGGWGGGWSHSSQSTVVRQPWETHLSCVSHTIRVAAQLNGCDTLEFDVVIVVHNVVLLIAVVVIVVVIDILLLPFLSFLFLNYILYNYYCNSYC